MSTNAPNEFKPTLLWRNKTTLLTLPWLQAPWRAAVSQPPPYLEPFNATGLPASATATIPATEDRGTC